MSVNQLATFDAAMTLVREYVAKNPIPPEMLPTLIANVFTALNASARGAVPVAAAGAPAASVPTVPIPAVPITQSVTDDHVICLEDGTQHKMMKRYLARMFNLTPEAYRAKWGLPPNYPMTAPGYSEVKRLEAKRVGLGTESNKRGETRAVPEQLALA